ncbi:hypothetical protein P7H17_25195 [Paenibacillus larvae]|nr:hypothetical protein [Paenibacillus larvae]MDT2288682.1 hypothetical protein [Paenibacillus larvae]
MEFNISIVKMKDADKIGWLFNYGKKESVEKELYQAIIKRSRKKAIQ